MAYELKTLEFNKILDILSKYAKTDMAKEEISNLKPINDLDIINKMLSEVNDAYNAYVGYDELPLNSVKGIYNEIKRASIGGMLNEMELVSVSSLIGSVNNIIKYKGYVTGSKITIDNIESYFNSLKVLPKLKSTIDHAIDSNGNVSDNASMELFNVRKQISLHHNRLRSKLNDILNSKASMLTESLIVTRQNRLCVPVKVEFKNTFKGAILDESSSGTTVYIEPAECGVIATELEVLHQKERREIENVLKFLTLEVNANAQDLTNNLDMIKALDIIFAKAYYMKAMDLIIPTINNKGFTKLIGAKHPLISKDVVVPTDIHFGDKFNTVIITGPNTGGKTVVLKTVGLITLMAQTGIPVPVKNGSTISIFDDVFVDIGDEQSIEQNLSTFSSYMTKICKIIDNVNVNSLVLLDELGSGTDPKEGASLAISIIDYLRNRGARVITTTHYSDLKAYAYQNKDICNASVEFNPETLKPTYKLLMGVPGKSNALLIAKRLGLNDIIINQAKELNNNRATDSQALMEQLDEENSNVNNLKNIYEAKIADYNKKIEELEREKRSIEKDRSNILNKSREEAKAIIKEAKEKSDLLLKEIDSIRREANVKEHKIADIKFAARNLTLKDTDDKIFDQDLKVGDYVYVASYNKEGYITKIKKDIYTVQIEMFSVDFKKTDLELAKPPAKKPIKKVKVNTSPLSKDAPSELDLRGFRYEEVEDAVDQFIDRALLCNKTQVSIIHGFGTGGVRKAVHDYLKRCSYVKSYRFGGEGEGLNGVTIVYLK